MKPFTPVTSTVEPSGIAGSWIFVMVEVCVGRRPRSVQRGQGTANDVGLSKLMISFPTTRREFTMSGPVRYHVSSGEKLIPSWQIRIRDFSAGFP